MVEKFNKWRCNKFFELRDIHSTWKRDSHHNVFDKNNVLKSLTQNKSSLLFNFIFQVVDLRVYYESTPSPLLSWIIFLNFSKQLSMTTIVRSHLPENG